MKEEKLSTSIAIGIIKSQLLIFGGLFGIALLVMIWEKITGKEETKKQ